MVVLNDPGRLLAVHLVHTGLVAGWASSMLGYECSKFDPTDPVFNPMWRQGMFVLPFLARLGVANSWARWSTLSLQSAPSSLWTIETTVIAHLLLAGLLWAASLWHWVFWDLDVFRDQRSNQRVIDSPKLFGVHLALSGILCLGFGVFHLGTYPGFLVSDAFGITGGLVVSSPDWTIRGFDAFNPDGVVAHHLAAGLVGILGGTFHLSCRPSFALYLLLRMGNVETVLSSSIIAVAWAACVVSGTMWFGSITSPVQCFGPTRYAWDLGLMFYH